MALMSGEMMGIMGISSSNEQHSKRPKEVCTVMMILGLALFEWTLTNRQYPYFFERLYFIIYFKGPETFALSYFFLIL